MKRIKYVLEWIYDKFLYLFLIFERVDKLRAAKLYNDYEIHHLNNGNYKERFEIFFAPILEVCNIKDVDLIYNIKLVPFDVMIMRRIDYTIRSGFFALFFYSDVEDSISGNIDYFKKGTINVYLCVRKNRQKDIFITKIEDGQMIIHKAYPCNVLVGVFKERQLAYDENLGFVSI